MVDLDFEKHLNMIYLYFQNLGRTTAHNVRLSFTPTLQSSVTGDDLLGFFTHIFPTLPPGKRIDSFLDSAIERLAKGTELSSSYEATVVYEDRHGKTHTDRYRLDIEAFRGRTFVDETDIEDVAKALKDIAGQLYSGWKSSYGGIKAVTQSEEDAERDRQERFDSIRELRRQAANQSAEPENKDHPRSP